MSNGFELLLFSTNPDFIGKAEQGGIDGVIIDWENLGKEQRQRGADTQINHDTVEDLRTVRRACPRTRVICRVNPFGPTTADELEWAVAGGADEILLPMVRHPAEVAAVMGLLGGRSRLGILVETNDAVTGAADLARFPLSRVYVGLNDLAIERRSPNIFHGVLDGTVERMRAVFEVPFGFGGLTLPEGGAPIPCRLLIAEMARIGCDFSFLRRSFHRDVAGCDPAAAVSHIRLAVDLARRRAPTVIARERCELENAIRAWPGPKPHPDEPSPVPDTGGRSSAVTG